MPVLLLPQLVADVVKDSLDQTEIIDLGSLFTDPDGDVLTFSTTSSNEAVATAIFSGNIVTVTGIAVGSSTITLSADDGFGGITDEIFSMSVSIPTGIHQSELGLLA